MESVTITTSFIVWLAGQIPAWFRPTSRDTLRWERDTVRDQQCVTGPAGHLCSVVPCLATVSISEPLFRRAVRWTGVTSDLLAVPVAPRSVWMRTLGSDCVTILS
jgi:hypothetical protein